MAPNKTAPAGWTPARGDGHIREPLDSTTHTTSTEARRGRMLAALKRGPVDTYHARQRLDIAHPAGRVRELRRAGHDITTQMQERTSQAGERHRVGVYRLADQGRTSL